MNSAALINFKVDESFWELADMTKASEKYKIDKNLQYLKFASLDILKKIFVQYRFFTHYYITDLAILISKLPFGEIRTILGEILYEELGNGRADDAHPTLYDEFLLSIGIPKADLDKANQNCIENLKTIQASLIQNPWAYGIGLRGMGGECLCQIYLATMHEYFSKNPVIVSIKDQVAWKFWDIHIGEIDLHHQKIIRSAINNLVMKQPETTKHLVNGYLESKYAWDSYWEQIFRAARNHSE